MTIRTALWACPLTVSVAVLAHLAAFGGDHAPGGEHAPILFGGLALMLGAALVATFAGGLLGRALGPIATGRRCRYAPLFLAAAGAATFALIECSEGHSPFAALLRASLFCIPFAYLLALAAASARRATHDAGRSCARAVFGMRRGGGTGAAIRLDRGRRLAFAASVACGATRGRAPPPSR
jgi:hypothetical protein